MKRQTPKRPVNGRASLHGSAVNECRALVPADGAGIRKKIKKDYEKALRDLDNSRRQLDVFQQTDLPQFTRWLNTHFGELLTELRELGQKIAMDEQLIFQVENEVLFRGGSYARAYRRVMEFRENPEPPVPPSAGSGDGEGGARPEFDSGDREDPFASFFDGLFGESGPGKHPPENDGPWGESESGAPARASARLKELYRAVVRRLHPDSQQEMTAQKTEWWHQAQAAYEAGDADQLEVILTLCEIGENGTTAYTSLSLLQRITAQLKSSLREIKRQIAMRRRDPAWGFSRRADHATMAVQMRRVLTGDLEMMRERWREMQETLAGWKAAAERLGKPRRAKGRAQGAQFPS